jgi:hypothetical protein
VLGAVDRHDPRRVCRARRCRMDRFLSIRVISDLLPSPVTRTKTA